MPKYLATAWSVVRHVYTHWAPPLVCTFLAVPLAKGGFQSGGEIVAETWDALHGWATFPVYFPRWFVLFGMISLVCGGLYLYWKLYMRYRALLRQN